MRRRLSAALSLAIATSGVAPALAADYVEAPPVVVTTTALVPSCEDPSVLAQVEDQFEYGTPNTVHAALQVVEFSNLFEKSYQPKGGHKLIERRYCQGTALISSGERRTIYYVIEHPMGFAGVSWRAEGCFLGLDPWKVYGANCESLRRF
ncbi:hypothetical protein NS365_08125 [Aureimonas ureilytica]|uniref:Uncharacterized protein n=1 Tax=Aureimonas ureilytica TaxID=401562 RepID=A0A175RR64_9HYPH|nr:hypothetical protein [Aureimonas ureilytica]KTR06216.1 hypothetical protein NS365_08125 [Aureimonas ureilytica]